MVDHMMSGEDQRKVAITSIPAGDPSLTGASTPRSTADTKLSQLESLEEKLLKDQDDLDGEEHSPEAPLINKVAAEFIGTFLLVFTVLSSIVREEQQGGVWAVLCVATLAGLAAGTLTGVVVHVSGSHLNPAVSLAMAAFGRLPRAHVVPYAAAQTTASAAAAFLAKAVYQSVPPEVMATVPPLGSAALAFLMELVLTFVLVFAITAGANHPKRSKELVVIISWAAAMSMKWPSTGPSMNPARTLGAALATGKYTGIWVYLVAPPLGALAGAGTYTVIKKP
ncbi:hypothetical protein QOZ80_8BG0644960 [Eleusine coracana subsp. coracana]|nr:hypothetical protein QOZ80_8BG0644960 [Eleusine coracana subsp. coracana]